MKKLTSMLLAFLLVMGLLTVPITGAAATNLSAGAVSTAGGSLNVRASASTSSSVVASLCKGSYVTLVSKAGDWWRVSYGKDKYGYCHGGYITPISGTAATVATRSMTLNVRSGAGISYRILGSLSRGEAVVVLSASGGWSRILYHGTKTGYVSSRYLSTSAPGYGAVSLAVPGFKQGDSRWANVTIGSSGKTMAQIGCATTALAMMESYRTGKTIYPDAMAKQLSYTSSGNVYWPSHYTVVTNSAGYLDALYTKLQQGKPILFGAKTAAGKQHWVVITGFTGGDILTAAGFAIQDPGTHSRTNLQHFLNAYPVFYKFFYY